MKKFFTLLTLICACLVISCGGEKCLPNKNIGDVVVVTQKTLAAKDRRTYNKMMEAAKDGNNSATTDMLLAGQLRVVMAQTRGTIKEKDGTRALILLPDDKVEWWINENFLE